MDIFGKLRAIVVKLHILSESAGGLNELTDFMNLSGN